jgi:RNA polymerase sigma-70 factor (ECF subfamily)
MTEPTWSALSTQLTGRFRRWGASAELAEDLRQETLIRVQRGLPHLEDSARLGPWVARIARNAWIDHLRGARVAESLEEHHAADDRPSPAESLDREVDAFVASWLPIMIDGLDEPYRTALRRVELEGWSQQRLAAELGLSASGARTRVQRGRQRLRAAVDACCTVAWEGGQVVDVQPRIDGCSC